jgi:hypothetical protein
MDRFRVTAKDTNSLDRSHLVSEMQAEARQVEMFPVLIGTQIGYFHDVDGGYDRDNGWHVVNLIHRVQGADSPTNKIYSDTIEVHLGEDFFHLEVADVWQMGEYPDDDFVLSLKVTDYMQGPYSFSEAMSADIDKREEEYTPNNE